jgi:hypothetical protein
MNEQYDDKSLEALWAELEDIPCVENNESVVGLSLAVDWRQFKAGADMEEIWRFFDENYSQGVAYLLYHAI